MKVTSSPDVSNLTTIEDFKRYVSQVISNIVSVVNGNISIPDNLAGQSISVTFSAANTDTPVDHTLNRIISNYVILNLSGNMVVYNGSSASTATRIYLRSSATGTATVFLT